MIGKIIFGLVIALITMLIWSDIGLRSAAACNKIAGCIMDDISENYEMMRSGKMSRAMAEGKDNIDAFNRLKDRERSMSASRSIK